MIDQPRDAAGYMAQHPGEWFSRAQVIGMMDQHTEAAVKGKARVFPIIADLGGKVKAHPLRVPWSVAEKAFSVYSGLYGNEQSLDRLAERGGFHAGEMDMFHPTWREEAGEIADLTARLAAAESQLRYPDDPARSVAAMLSRMSPEDKQAFNFCVKAASQAMAASPSGGQG